MMSLLIVPKIACQRIFGLSDSGVARTFVVDCRLMTKAGLSLNAGRLYAEVSHNKV